MVISSDSLLNDTLFIVDVYIPADETLLKIKKIVTMDGKNLNIQDHYQKIGMAETKIVTRFWIVGILLAVLTIITLKIR